MTTAKNPEAKNEAKDFVFAFPKPDDWKNIVHDLKLTKIQERELEITVRHVLPYVSAPSPISTINNPNGSSRCVRMLKSVRRIFGRPASFLKLARVKKSHMDSTCQLVTTQYFSPNIQTKPVPCPSRTSLKYCSSGTAVSVN